MRLAFVMMAGALLLAGASAAARAADGGVDRGCIEARVIGEQRIDGEHEYKPGAIALSPDDRLVASGDKGGNVILWDLASGKRRKSWRAPSGAVWSLAFSADGKSLIAGYGNDTVRIIALGSSARPLVLAHAGQSVAAAGPGTFVSAGRQGITTRRIATGAVVSRLDPKLEMVSALAVAPTGDRLAASFDKQVVLCTGASCRPLAGASSLVLALQFSPEGTELVASSYNDYWTWELTGEPQPARAAPGGKSVFAGGRLVVDRFAGREILESEGQAGFCFSPPTGDHSLGDVAASSRWVAATDLSGFGVLVWPVPAPAR